MSKFLAGYDAWKLASPYEGREPQACHECDGTLKAPCECEGKDPECGECEGTPGVVNCHACEGTGYYIPEEPEPLWDTTAERDMDRD